MLNHDENRILIAYIKANKFTFNVKYRVEVEQMEVSQPVFEFLEGIRDQVDNASSIFQPPFFELKGNIQVTGGNGKVVGIFSAAAVARKSI